MTIQAESKPKQNTLMIDASACIGCHACTMACRLENDLPDSLRPIFAILTGPLETDNGLMAQYYPVTCFHCDRPACVPACPTGAMQKRDDGLVFSDPELCIGCQTCAVACPFGHPQLNPATGKIAKCDGCRQRVDQGLWPSCALKCPSGALAFGTPARLVQDSGQQRAKRIARSLTLETRA